MKTQKTLHSLLALLMCAVMALSLCACNKAEETPSTQLKTSSSDQATTNDPLWKTATYTEDVTLGEGKTKIDVDVIAGEKSITVTINTDAITLEDALKDVDLVEGEESKYGLFIKKVNGIEADYDKDQTYWSISKGGEYMNSGASAVTIKSGEKYEFTRTK